MTLLESPDKRISSRRVGGIVYLTAALVIAIFGWLNTETLPDGTVLEAYMSFDVWVSLVVIGGSLLGITGLDQFGKHINKQ